MAVAAAGPLLAPGRVTLGFCWGFITREYKGCKAEPRPDVTNLLVTVPYGSQGWAKCTVQSDPLFRIWIRKAYSYYLLHQASFLNYQNPPPSVGSALKM